MIDNTDYIKISYVIVSNNVLFVKLFLAFQRYLAEQSSLAA